MFSICVLQHNSSPVMFWGCVFCYAQLKTKLQPEKHGSYPHAQGPFTQQPPLIFFPHKDMKTTDAVDMQQSKAQMLLWSFHCILMTRTIQWPILIRGMFWMSYIFHWKTKQKKTKTTEKWLVLLPVAISANTRDAINKQHKPIRQQRGKQHGDSKERRNSCGIDVGLEVRRSGRCHSWQTTANLHYNII